MKVSKILAKDARVGMYMVTGSKEDYQIHQVSEVHIRPKEDYGMISVGTGRIKFQFKPSDNPNIRITDEPGEAKQE